MKELILLSCVLILSACVTTPRFERVKVPAGKGVVYTYRSNMLTGYTLQSYISVGEEEVNLNPGRYEPWVLKPGEYTVESRCPGAGNRNRCKDSITIVVAEGKETYVRFDADGGDNVGEEIKKGLKKVGGRAGKKGLRGFLHNVEEHKGLKEIEGMRQAI